MSQRAAAREVFSLLWAALTCGMRVEPGLGGDFRLCQGKTGSSRRGAGEKRVRWGSYRRGTGSRLPTEPVVYVLGNNASRVSYQFLIRGERGKWFLLPAQRGVSCSGTATQQAGQGWDRSLPSLGVPPAPNRWEGAASAGVSREGNLLCSGLVASPVGLCGTFR